MDIQGTRIINAPINAVWQALNSADILRQAIPGCQALDGNFAEGFSATIKQKIGPIATSFSGKVTISDVVMGKSYIINGSGDGGVAGKASGSARVDIEEISPGQTQLTYQVAVNISGKIMQLGARVIEPVVKKNSDQFFDAFNDLVGNQ